MAGIVEGGLAGAIGGAVEAIIGAAPDLIVSRAEDVEPIRAELEAIAPVIAREQAILTKIGAATAPAAACLPWRNWTPFASKALRMA